MAIIKQVGTDDVGNDFPLRAADRGERPRRGCALLVRLGLALI